MLPKGRRDHRRVQILHECSNRNNLRRISHTIPHATHHKTCWNIFPMLMMLLMLMVVVVLVVMVVLVIVMETRQRRRVRGCYEDNRRLGGPPQSFCSVPVRQTPNCHCGPLYSRHQWWHRLPLRYIQSFLSENRASRLNYFNFIDRA